MTLVAHPGILCGMSYIPLRLLFCSLALATLATGCVTAPAPVEEPIPVEPVLEPVEVPPVAPDKTAELEALSKSQAFEIRQLKEELAATELRLIAASAQVERLKVAVEESRFAADEAIAEVVRTQARLQGNVSQADAASNIAEAEILLSGYGDLSTPALDKVREQLLAASTQFDAGNYGGAMYLSNQARRGLSAAKDQVEILSPVANEQAFGDLLEMWVVSDSNLRGGPGLSHPVVTILKRGAQVSGYSFNGAWVRVRVDDMLEGWVFQPLLSQTNPLPTE